MYIVYICTHAIYIYTCYIYMYVVYILLIYIYPQACLSDAERKAFGLRLKLDPKASFCKVKETSSVEAFTKRQIDKKIKKIN